MSQDLSDDSYADNGLVPPATKPLLETVFAKIYDTISMG